MADGRESGDREGGAWEAARAYGFDMSLLEESLRRTPLERIRLHERAAALARQLRTAMEERLGRQGVAAGQIDPP